jgi:hypothetical protein
VSAAANPAAEAQAAAVQDCRNCGAALAGPYCSACGQEARIETPTVGEFVREFVQDQMALEGKLLRTLKRLVTRPGVLTVDYLSGRRQCYIRPLRLYLAASVVFFAVSGLNHQSPWFRTDPGEENKPLFTVPQEAPPPAGAKAAPAAAPKPGGGEAPAFPTDDDLRELTTGSPLLDARIHKYFKQTRGQAYAQINQAIANDAPLAMFFLLPLFAGLLQLAYLRHHLRYGVHLLFALHYHAFVFLDLLLQQVPWPSLIDGLLKLAIPLYLVLALRQVYGGRWWLTALGVGVLLLVYSVLIGITLFAAAVVSILMSG